ncbi:MAG: hypothetical protein Q7S86_01585 [bacterium]|nr:hypothetical protein [bacterium]
MIEITTGIMLLLSMLYGPATADAKIVDVKTTVESYTGDPAIIDGVALMAPNRNTKTVESDVREYFKDIPILAEIAKCESEFKHVGGNGEIIKGKVNRGDLGVMQINKYYHEEDASKLGLDLKTLRGNMVFARNLYDKYGTSPWKSSSGCWEKYVTIAKK